MRQHWLDRMVEKYGNDQNKGRDPYPVDKYEYGWGGNGEDTDGDGKGEFDCSHFVNRILRDMCYDIPYETTAQMRNSKYYSEIDPSELSKRDIVLFEGHVGFY